MKKRLFLWLILLVVCLGIGAVVLGWLAVKEITPERLVREIEASRNCRAVIDGCRLSLFSSPARLDLTGVTLVPRDAEADNATPYATRPPIELHATYFRFGSATLEADLLDLVFKRRLTVRQFVIRNADVKCDLLPGGENTLKQLFDSPAIVGGKTMRPPLVAVPVAAAAAAAQTVTDAAREAVEKKPPPDDASESAVEADNPGRRFNVRDFAIPSTIKRVAIENSRLRFRNRKSRGVIEFNNCTASLTDIAVDPAHLDTTNRATLDVQTTIFVDGRVKKTRDMFRYAALSVGVHGAITPFDPSGNLNPDMGVAAKLDEGSTVQGLPVLQKLQKKVDKAQEAGLRLPDLAARAELQRETTFNLQLHDNRMHLTEPVALAFADYSLSLDRGSFIDASEECHQFRATWTASESISSRALAEADQFLAGLGPEIGTLLRKALVTPLVKDDRIALAFASSGTLDDPKVEIENPLGDLKNQLKETRKNLLDSIQGAFSRGGERGKREGDSGERAEVKPDR